MTPGLKQSKVSGRIAKTTEEASLPTRVSGVRVRRRIYEVRGAPSRVVEEKLLNHGVVVAAHAAYSICDSSWSAQTWYDGCYPIEFWSRYQQ